MFPAIRNPEDVKKVPQGLVLGKPVVKLSV